MTEEQNRELKEKLEAQQAEFENYKNECKQLEEFLEEESNKKEEQIRQLKQESIKKEKTYSLLKAQVGQLESEITNLKAELKQKESSQSASGQVGKQLAQANKKVQALQAQLSNKNKQNESLKEKYESQIKDLTNEQNQKTKKLAEKDNALKELEKQIEKLMNAKDKTSTKVEEKKSAASPEKVTGHDNEGRIKKLERQLETAVMQSKRSEETSLKLSKQMKDLKNMNHSLSIQRENLLRKIKEISLARSAKKEEEKQESVMMGEMDHGHSQMKEHNSISALIMTKKHYVSPFIQFKGENTIKLFKNTKNGCFDKSLGSTKFKLTEISYDVENLVNSCSNNVIESLNSGKKCSVILYGPKKTTKKYLMANIVMRVKDVLLEKLQESEEASAEFVKASQNQEERVEIQEKDKSKIEEVIDRVISLNQKSPKKHEIKKKGHSKPKARIFKITFSDDLMFEIITSSYTNIPVKDSLTLSDALNNICYVRLPNSLQQGQCYRQILLTVNPIVSLYQDCKNTLALLHCKKHGHQENININQWQDSPMKEDLNVSAKKKLQIIERQSQQNSLKVRRLEEDVGFYRTKFDELEVRLKNLLNTHNAQNSYLKKSPITLSYEKMLKFVHSVLARNNQSSNNAQNTQDEIMILHEGFASDEEVL